MKSACVGVLYIIELLNTYILDKIQFHCVCLISNYLTFKGTKFRDKL